jgi:uncharacterized membrane protein YoaK (UPF0700 family)
MTQEPDHHPSGPLAIAVALAIAAGFVDAHIYLHVAPVFVANMSGNLVRLGMFAGDGSWREASGAAVAVVAFSVGVVLAVVEHDRRLRRSGHLRPDVLLAVEALLLVAVCAVRAGLGTTFQTQLSGANAPVIVVAAIAMGVQAATLRRVGAIAVATTYGTGAIVRVGEKVALASRRAGRTTSLRRRVTITVLMSVLVSYVLGAALAAALGSSPWLLLLPSGALVLSAVGLRATSGLADSSPRLP